MESGLPPACAKTCPTGAITFGEREERLAAAKKRLEELRAKGDKKARIYGERELSGLGSFYLLVDEPLVYRLPDEPKFAVASVFPDSAWSVGDALLLGLTTLVAFRERGKGESGRGDEG